MNKNTTKKSRVLSVSYEEELFVALKNPSEAIAYLQVSLTDEDPRVQLVALDHVIRANGGMNEKVLDEIRDATEKMECD